MTRLLLITFFLYGQFSYGQGLDTLSGLIRYIQKGENDSIRVEANKRFHSAFEKILIQQGSFSRNFDSLKNISVTAPDDGRFRLYTWVLPHYDGNKYEYFGFLQYKFSADNDSIILAPLHDSTDVILKPESEKLTPHRWLGVVYYGIRTVKKKKTTYYTLFGWKGKNEAETQKLLDVLHFNKNKPQFGYPLFKTGSVFKSRLIYTFPAQSTMVLNFDKNFGGIVFDHLAVNKKDPFLLSGPDGTYDAFRWKKGRWQLYRDVDVRTKWKPAEALPEPEEK